MSRDGRKVENLTGRRIEHFVVLGESGKYFKNKRPIWLCKCDCGNTFEKPSRNLLYGNTIDCGCGAAKRRIDAHTKHGMSGSGTHPTRIYRIWQSMKARCKYPSTRSYDRYGGRGIKVCEEWLGENGFQNFYEWSNQNGYSDELSIDRINGDGDYEPNNCRWVSFEVQENNRCNNTLFLINGEVLTLSQLCEKEHVTKSVARRKFKDNLIQQIKRGDSK